MAVITEPRPSIPVLCLDEGDAGSLDALAASVAIFGADRFELLYAPDRETLHRMTEELAVHHADALVVVDADHHPEPKSLLAEAADTGFPLVVLSNGHSDAIQDHALSVGAAAYLLSTLPASDLLDRLAAI
jgi:DNA-binding NarL/FixJ family response regulator